MFPAVGCRVLGSDVTPDACSARRFALPAARSPSPCAIRRARRAGRRFPLPLGRGCALSRRGARRLRSPPPPTPPRGLPASRGLPPPRRESGTFPRSTLRAPRVSVLFSFPRGVRRCGAPPLSGRRHAPPPSCAFSLPLARASLPSFLPRVLSPFRECSCGVFPMRRDVRFARCLARRVPRRFARSRDSCRASRAGWCLCPRAVPASGQGHACTRLNHVKMLRRNVKIEMLKTHRRRRPASPPSLVRFNSVYYLCGVLVMFNFSPLREGCPAQSRIYHYGKR